jgi:hypothetical protein
MEPGMTVVGLGMTVGELTLKVLAEEAIKAIKKGTKPTTALVKRCTEYLGIHLRRDIIWHQPLSAMA